EVSLELFSITGARLKVLQSPRWMPDGVHQLTLNAADLQTGMLFLRMRAGEKVLTQKVVLMR
ncbi:MAG: hypothetical protein R3350_10040, partial [Saprospiraceae bacterium]|nr:hypothetical protein [Saprospiraceae bacterium]